MQAYRFLILIVCLVLGLALPAHAQSQLADGLSGFSGGSDQPIEIEANTLEVSDADKTAVFIGNVLVRQGEATLKTGRLKVFYEGNATPNPQAETAEQGNQKIKRLEASETVLVTSRDQTATSQTASFDMASDTIVMKGNVVLTQSGNIVKGQTLTIDLKSRQSRMQSGNGRVQGLFQPSSQQRSR